MAESTATPDSARTSVKGTTWHAVFLRHAKLEWATETYYIHDAIKTKRFCSSEASDRPLHLQPFIDGSYRAPWQPLRVLVALAGHRWIHLLPRNDRDLSLVDQLGKSKKLYVLVAGHDSTAQRTYLRYYDRGKQTIRFEAIGAFDEPMEKPKFKSSAHSKSFLEQQRTPAALVKAILKELDAALPHLRLEEHGSNLKLVPTDGKALTPKMIREVLISKEYFLMQGDNPASDRLDEALDRGDSRAVQEALAQGASLQHMPESNITPLSCAILRNHTGDWAGCIRALVAAGCPLEGFPNEDPMVYAVSIHDARDQASTVETLDVLLELGADINAKSRLGAGILARQTLLHKVAFHKQFGVVKYLIARGADPLAHDANGRTARDFLELYTKGERLSGADFYAPWEAICAFLRRAESGSADTSDWQQLTAIDTRERGERVEKAMERLSQLGDSPLGQVIRTWNSATSDG
jgi:hypothetical protein